MRKLLLASVAVLLAAPAVAADLPTKKEPVPIPVPLAYDWTGIFFGGNIGWAWGNGNFNAYSATTGLPTGSGSNNFNSFIGGGQVGYRYMFPQRFVIGALASLDWNTSNSVTNSEFIANKIYASSLYSSGINGNVLGLAGYAFGDFLPYAVGGWAWNDETITHTQLFGKVGNLSAGTAESINPYRSGWSVGAGLSYHFWSNWEVFGQYLYTSYGTSNLYFPASLQVYHSSLSVNAITGGVNLKF